MIHHTFVHHHPNPFGAIKMSEFRCIVKCPKCGQEHFTDEVSFLNVEEDFYGRDVFHYLCPETGETTSSLVFSNCYES